VKDATKFPDMMAVAAADDEDLAYAMGRAAALEGRACGIHWSFGPVMDINANPLNPITNTRSLGDDPDRVSRLGRRIIRGMQDYGFCACAKHFPGDGYDFRDQHVCTTINPLPMDAWHRLSGRMFRDAIQAGVWSVMIGHIALPACDPGGGHSLRSAPPATLSRKLVTGLLRGELGFDGLIITDALGMGGILTRATRRELLLGALEAGCDMLLFVDLKGDFEILLQAARDGHLSEDRIDNSVRRILGLKVQLGLDQHTAPTAMEDTVREEIRAASRHIAEKAITVVEDRHRALPLDLAAGKHVLSFHLRGDPLYNVDAIDNRLRERGLEVTRITEQDPSPLWYDELLNAADFLLVHVVYGPSWMTNRIRPVGNALRELVMRISVHDPRVVFIAYGSPYLLLDFPEIPALLNAYSPDPATQEAVVRVLTGELAPAGRSPVDIRRLHGLFTESK
jgi:beta-N-acetylhexosaminidase